MFSTRKITAVSLMALFSLSLLAVASPDADATGTRNPKMNARQIKQDKRINQGIRSGELTKKEAVRLQANQSRINYKEQKFKSDGALTAAERARLNNLQDKQNKVIYKQKHDNQDRN